MAVRHPVIDRGYGEIGWLLGILSTTFLAVEKAEAEGRCLLTDFKHIRP